MNNQQMQVGSQESLEEGQALNLTQSTSIIPHKKHPQTSKSRETQKVPEWMLSHSQIIASIVLLSVTLWFFWSSTLAELVSFHFARIYEKSTVGAPTPGLAFNFSRVKQSERYEFQSQILREVKPFNDSSCKYNNIGGSVFCQNVIKKSIALLNIASKQPDIFGCEVSSSYDIFNYYYGCQKQHFPLCNSVKNFASLKCVGEVTEEVGSKAYETLQDIIIEHNLSDQFMILRMNVEGQKTWESFISFPTSYLQKIDQLILDFHIQDAAYWGYLEVFKTFSQFYYPVNLHMNNKFCYGDAEIQTKNRKLQSSVFQVTYVRKQLVKLESQTKSYVQSTVNKKDFPSDDCQMLDEIHISEPNPISLIKVPASELSLHRLQGDHVHLKEVQSSKTVGIQKIGQFFQSTKINSQRKAEYHAYIASIFEPYNDTNCQYSRYGKEVGEGFILCKNIMKKSTALLNIGIIENDRFGCELTSQFLIPNFQYDCTSKVKPYCRTNSNGNIFTEACIGQRSQFIAQEGRVYYSLKDIIDSRNLANKHITLKIGIQGQQWSALRSLPLSYLQNIDQIVLQMHLYQNFAYLEGNLNILRTLSQYFYPVNLHMNNKKCWQQFTDKLSSSVFEVTLVNKQMLRLYSSDRSYMVNVLNKPSDPALKDCQISASID